MGANDLAQNDLHRFLSRVREFGLCRKANSDHHLYERLKAELGRMNVTPEEYTGAIQVIAKACGV